MSEKLEKLGADLENARNKRRNLDNKIKDMEIKYQELEKTEIHEMVQAANLTPDQLAELLHRFKSEVLPQLPENKEEIKDEN